MPLPTERTAFRLRRRPTGRVTDADLELVREPIPALRPGQALVRTRYVSLDPSNRIWMSEVPSYIDPVPIGAVMRALGAGEVIASEREDFPVGSMVLGWTGFQDFFVMDDETDEGPFTILPDPLPAPLSMFLGALGHTGITAYLGLEDYGRVQPGETVVISAAAGAVGSIAGQIAKSRGARAVGIAGGPEKCRYVVETLGFDACVDYKAADFAERFAAAVPDGVDVDFENVGGPVMDTVVAHLNIGARVVLCGLISEYEADGRTAWAGSAVVTQVLMRRASMHGFLVLDETARFPEAIAYLAGLLGEGHLQGPETIVDGLEHAVDCINRIFEGSSTGKLLLRLEDPAA